jgi:hypothetical protein
MMGWLMASSKLRVLARHRPTDFRLRRSTRKDDAARKVPSTDDEWNVAAVLTPGTVRELWGHWQYWRDGSPGRLSGATL